MVSVAPLLGPPEEPPLLPLPFPLPLPNNFLNMAGPIYGYLRNRARGVWRDCQDCAFGDAGPQPAHGVFAVQQPCRECPSTLILIPMENDVGESSGPFPPKNDCVGADLGLPCRESESYSSAALMPYRKLQHPEALQSILCARLGVNDRHRQRRRASNPAWPICPKGYLGVCR